MRSKYIISIRVTISFRVKVTSIEELYFFATSFNTFNKSLQVGFFKDCLPLVLPSFIM